MEITAEPTATPIDSIGEQSDVALQAPGAVSDSNTATAEPSPLRSLKSSFLIVSLASVLVILIAFFTYLETSQYSAAKDQITEKLGRMLDSGSILLADATARKRDDELLLLLAPFLGDSDVISVAVDLSNGRRLAAYGDDLETIENEMILRRAIIHDADGVPARIGTFLVGLTHKRINRELEERLRNDLILALLIFGAIVMSAYHSLYLSVMRPMRILMSAIEGWEIDHDHKPVDWNRNDEFGQLISSFNQMQRRQQYSQEKLRIALQRAEGADQAKATFLAIIGHELRTPLNSVIGFSDLLKSKVADDGNDEQGAYLDDINKAGHVLLDMVNDILEITHAQAGKLTLAKEPISLCALVDEVVAECQSIRSGGMATIENAVPEDFPLLHADRARVARMLTHLVRNALCFTPAKSSIRVEANFDADGCHVAVTDTGCGIPENRLADLQEPFVQASTDWQNHGGGAGLGLTYVKNLAQWHGGMFHLDSVEGRGTSAVLTLPT